MFDLPVTGFYLAVIEIVELNRLLQGEDVFLPVVALKGLRDRFRGIPYTSFSHEGKLFRVPFPGYDCPMIFIPVTPVTFESTLCR